MLPAGRGYAPALYRQRPRVVALSPAWPSSGLNYEDLGRCQVVALAARDGWRGWGPPHIMDVPLCSMGRGKRARGVRITGQRRGVPAAPLLVLPLTLADIVLAWSSYAVTLAGTWTVRSQKLEWIVRLGLPIRMITGAICFLRC